VILNTNLKIQKGVHPTMINNNSTVFFAGFVIGGLVGVTLALLLAPNPGQETRAQLKTKGVELKDQTVKRVQDVGHRAQGQVAVWQEKGKETFEKGKHSAVEAFGHGKERVIEALSQRKEDLKHNGKEAVTEAATGEVEQSA
jgi:gas vesicle protein